MRNTNKFPPNAGFFSQRKKKEMKKSFEDVSISHHSPFLTFHFLLDLTDENYKLQGVHSDKYNCLTHTVVQFQKYKSLRELHIPLFFTFMESYRAYEFHTSSQMLYENLYLLVFLWRFYFCFILFHARHSGCTYTTFITIIERTVKCKLKHASMVSFDFT